MDFFDDLNVIDINDFKKQYGQQLDDDLGSNYSYCSMYYYCVWVLCWQIVVFVKVVKLMLVVSKRIMYSDYFGKYIYYCKSYGVIIV